MILDCIMTNQSHIAHFAEWYSQGKSVAQLVGIRTDESLNRWRAVASDNSQVNNYQDITWSQKMAEKCYSFYPIYDWAADDDWTYYGKFGKPYNHLYDLFYKAGISIYKMRVDEPFGNEAKAGLNMFRVIEPETWARVVNRVSGANFGNIYSGKKIMSAGYTLPKGHTWKSFCKFLLTTLPKETADAYRSKFIKFIRYWQKTGCPIRPDMISELESTCPDAIENLHKYSKRGNGDKEMVRARRVLDELPGLDNKQDLCTWKRMAMCIVKNDFVCKGLCFSITKDLTLRQKAIVEKYKNL
jgi:predicted phosphoadenosine phosphosulfate sulfurtransferase